jgi:hypothetical protein
VLAADCFVFRSGSCDVVAFPSMKETIADWDLKTLLISNEVF